MSNRTQTLKVTTPIKAQQDARLEISPDARAHRPGMHWTLDLERARLLTESYKQTENEPMVLRRAKSLAHILENMTVYIRPGELIVGNIAATPDSVAHFPEFAYKWVERETAPGKVYSEMLDDDGRAELKEIDSYWKDLAMHHMTKRYFPKELREITWLFEWDCATPNYEKVLEIGLNGIIREVEERKERLDREFMEGTVNAMDLVKQRNFLDSTIIALNAAINWGKRYAETARRQSKSEDDPVRKQELETIAEICDWVPGNPARTLHEALQCINFIHFVVTFIELPLVGWGIRLDKCCGRFYDDDLQAGRITRDQAQELVECLFVKNQETGYLHSPLWSGFGGGALGYQTLNIGGVDSKGKDITNEISYIVLDAMETIRTVTPPLALRYHDGTPKKLVEKAIEVIASGMPQPAFFNDKVNIPRLVELGAPIKDARNYSINNCMVPVISGKNRNHPSAWLNGIGLAGCLNEALGIEPLPGYFKKQGHKMEAPEKVTSVEELIDATIENFAWLTQRLVKMGNIMDAVYKEFAPRPLLSALTDDCINRAQDGREWIETPDYRDLMILGLNNTADSLAAIKKLVFDEKKVSMATMIEALKNNWEGYEDLQKMCLAAPKFGNDIDEVDAISAELGERIKVETGKLKTNWGTPVIPDGTSGTIHYLFGSTCAATADGRNAKETFHDGSVSPMGGRDNKGPTAVLNSVSKVNPLNTWNQLFNQSFMPEHVTGRNAELFAQYIKTWADLGIHHVQFSAVGKDTLVDAQNNPSENANLLVRVAGYAAYFVDLSKMVQDQIISRTPQTFNGPSC